MQVLRDVLSANRSLQATHSEGIIADFVGVWFAEIL